MKYPRVRGTEDCYPEDAKANLWIAEKLRKEARKASFLEVEPPALETIKCLTAKSGEEIKKQIFVLEKRGEEEIGLRFDLTVPMARMLIAKQKELPLPVKWFAIGKNWRYESPQKGRSREFNQFSVELFGSGRLESDAYLINLLIACFESLGLSSREVEIRLNNRKLLEGLLSSIVPEQLIASVARIVDKRKKIGEVGFIQELLKLGIDQLKAERIAHLTKFSGAPDEVFSQLEEHVTEPSSLAKNGIEELKATLALVPKEWIKLDVGTARGLEYYTGNIFEAFERKGELRSLAGGGRYDNLVEILGGNPCPATGFAIGFVTLLLLLKEKRLLPKFELGPDYYIAITSQELLGKAFELALRLRKKASVELDLMKRKLSKQLDYANAIGARKAIILGQRDLEKGMVTIRELQSGVERKARFEEVS